MDREMLVRPRPDAPAFELDVVCRGEHLDERTVSYARRKVAAACRAAPRPILFGRVKLTRETHHPADRVMAQAMVDVEGHPVRAHGAAHTASEAIDLLEERLRRQLDQAQNRIAFLRKRNAGTGAGPGEWRHGNPPATRPEYFPRHPDDRGLVRRKSFELERTSPEGAVVEMEMLDHDFHLFVDAATGQDAIVVRLDDGTYGMQRSTGDEDETDVVSIRLGPSRPPTLTVRSAIDRLNLTNEPFLFFVEAPTQRGVVLYRRYDGHYGLVEGRATTADEDLSATRPRQEDDRRGR